MAEELIELIKDVKLLNGFTKEQMLKFIKKCEVKSFDTGETIVKVGDLSRELYILVSGTCTAGVDVTTNVKNFVVQWLYPKDVLGEMSFFDGKPRSATIICKEPCKVISISPENFKELIEEELELGILLTTNMILIFIEKIRETHTKLEVLYWRGVAGSA